MLADRWTVLIIREVYVGIHRYAQLQSNLGIARNALAERIPKLVEHGLLERVGHRTEPDCYEYRLTERGRTSTRRSSRSFAGPIRTTATQAAPRCGSATQLGQANSAAPALLGVPRPNRCQDVEAVE